jgi:hypothetical protein
LPDLSSIHAPLTDDDLMGFGEHRDKKLKDVPLKYFTWMVDEINNYPRVRRSPRWIRVIDYIKSKK